MRFCSQWYCSEKPIDAPVRGEEKVDVLVVGASLPALVLARELRAMGYSVMIVNSGPIGGHHALPNVPTGTGLVPKNMVPSGLDIVEGVYTGDRVVQGNSAVAVKARHVVLGTGGVELPVAFKGSRKAPQIAATDALLAEDWAGRRVAVWGTTEWGVRVAVELAKRGAEVVLLDNSAYIRDTHMVKALPEASKLEYIYAVAEIERFSRGVMELVRREPRGVSRRSVKVDVLVSAVRTPNIYVTSRLVKLVYAPEVNGLIPRHDWLGVVDYGLYVVGEAYGWIHVEPAMKQAQLLAMRIAELDGVAKEGEARARLRELEELLLERPQWVQYINLFNRLERGLHEKGIYVEPNVVDVPHWPRYLPGAEELADDDVCPFAEVTLRDLARRLAELAGVKKLKPRPTHDEVDMIRNLPLRNIRDLYRWPETPAAEAICIPSAILMLGGALSQRPTWFLYAKPRMPYDEKVSESGP